MLKRKLRPQIPGGPYKFCFKLKRNCDSNMFYTIGMYIQLFTMMSVKEDRDTDSKNSCSALQRHSYIQRRKAILPIRI